MNEAQKFLSGKNLDDIVLNAKQYQENTPENANRWIYLSDVLKQYLAHNRALRTHDVAKPSEQLVCDDCLRDGMDKTLRNENKCASCGQQLAN